MQTEFLSFCQRTMPLLKSILEKTIQDEPAFGRFSSINGGKWKLKSAYPYGASI
jgi:hypothetical protein